MYAPGGGVGVIRKKRRADRSFGLHTFGEPGYPGDYDGAFRDNVRAFLADCAESEPYAVEGMPTWSIVLEEERHLTGRMTLLVLEEQTHNSINPHCDHCRCIGWSHHPVSTRRYHFIIPGPEFEDKPLNLAVAMSAVAGEDIAGFASGVSSSNKVCPNCNDPVPPPLMHCPACGEEAVQGSILDLHSHLLHGVLHSNGFGHLLRVNGREKGSRYASGREIMDLWDRICAMLRARKVSVEDIAKKRGLELRLLHCVAYGESWYGRWGYKFGHGSFGITQQMYSKAIEAIRGMPLAVMLQHFEGVDMEVLSIVSLYQRVSGQALQTVGDLVRFMMELKARLPIQGSGGTNRGSGGGVQARKDGGAMVAAAALTAPAAVPTRGNGGRKAAAAASPAPPLAAFVAVTPCRWSAKRLDLATQVIVEALKNCEKKWMPRQDVRDAARVYIGDTGLLDFVLKSLGNRVVGSHVVRRAVNPITKVLEYSLEDVVTVGVGGPTAPIGSKPAALEAAPLAAACEVGRAEVLRDIVYIYRNVLESYKPAAKRGGGKSILTALPTASRIILDTKQFIRDYRGETTRKCSGGGGGRNGGSCGGGLGGGGAGDWDHIIDDDEMLRVLCVVILRDCDPCRNRPSPPAELVVLPPHATVGDLKAEAQRAFRDAYNIFRDFRVETIPELDGDDEDLLFGAIESGSTVIVQGCGVDLYSEWRYEGGNDSWVVDCPCGARDDDGERMIACDVCEVWQHTRCGGIADMDPIPARFLCARCGDSLLHGASY